MCFSRVYNIMPTQRKIEDILRQHSQGTTDILDFSNCQLSPYRADQICNHLKCYGDMRRIQKLNFYNCGITSKVFHLIAEAIRSLPYRLQETDLRKNKLKTKTIGDIISVLAKTVSLVDVRGAFKDDGRPDNAIESEREGIKNELSSFHPDLCVVVDNGTIFNNIPTSTVIIQYQALTDGNGNYSHTTCRDHSFKHGNQLLSLNFEEDLLTELSP